MKKFATGLLAGVMLTSSITVFAAGGRTIEVFDMVKKVVVDKVEKPFDKANAPFVYNGTTYVPLRFIADALGEPIDWDSKTGTISIGETNNKNASHWDTDIKHMNFQSYQGSYSYWYDTKGKVMGNNLGTEYTNFLVLESTTFYSTAYALMEFPLNGQYNRFTAQVAPTNQYLTTQGSLDFKIYLDDKEVYNINIKNGDMPKDINIDISGANKIGFELSAHDTSNRYPQQCYFNVGVFDGEFIK